MSTLRQRQKEVRTRQIIEAARRLFVGNGYARTSMEAIADEAQVGVATIYTYFEGKEGVAAALILKDAEQIQTEAEVCLANLPDTPAAAIISLLEVYEDYSKYISRELMRELAILARTKGGPVKAALVSGHNDRLNGLFRVLEHCQTEGSVSPVLDIGEAARLILDLLDRHMKRVTDEIEGENHEGELSSLICLLFENWTR